MELIYYLNRVYVLSSYLAFRLNLITPHKDTPSAQPKREGGDNNLLQVIISI